MSHPQPEILFVFPGQGSEYRGMGRDLCRELACAREIYRRAADALDVEVADLSFVGSRARLDQSELTHPALLTHSVACLEVFRELTGGRWQAAAMGGHGLGEYAALVAAGALDFDDALRLVRIRARVMAQYGRGRMAAFRLDRESIKPFADACYCGIGGCNLPDHTVVCGFEHDIETLMAEVAQRYGPERAGRYLETEGALHTYLMTDAAERFRPHLDAVPLRPPTTRVLSNYTGDYHAGEPERIRAALFFQMFHPVRFMGGLLRAIDDGVRVVVELGGGVGREPGEAEASPAACRPNLEGVTRKAFGIAGRSLLYLPAIDLAGLEHAARTLEALHGGAVPALDEADGGGWIEERHFCLYLPVHEGVAGEAAMALDALVQEMGLGAVVHVATEAADQSLSTLQCCCDPGIAVAEPYLEVVVGGSTGAFLHYRGEDIRRELGALRDRLGRHGALAQEAGEVRAGDAREGRRDALRIVRSV